MCKTSMRSTRQAWPTSHQTATLVRGKYRLLGNLPSGSTGNMM
jgi:hypothetical protein